MTKERKREYDRAWCRQRSPEKKARKVALQAARRHRIRAEIAKLKQNLSCKCGERHPACLDFHHHGDDKVISIGDAVKHGFSVERIMREIEKCDVMCANCHRKLHWELNADAKGGFS